MKAPIRKVEKPWGYELIWAETKDYVGKMLHIKAGHQLSLQYHRVKEETIYLVRGRMKVLYAETPEGNLKEIILAPGDAHHVPPRAKHRMVAVEDCEVFEVSTPHLDDVVRIEDSYGRTGV
jgi:mannose-6-phosphate isomerase-like protein (cupin superfamily)